MDILYASPEKTRSGDSGISSRPRSYRNQSPKASGSSVHFSRPETYFSLPQTRSGRFGMNQTTSRESARYALRIRHLQEERALQQRTLDAEKRALTLERQNLWEKYELLQKHIRKKADDYCETNIHKSSGKGFHGRSTDQWTEPHQPITQSGMQPTTSIQPVCLESITDRQQLLGNQQRDVRAFSTSNSQAPQKLVNSNEKLNNMISVASLDTFSADYPARTGGCVNYSHPDSCDNLQRQEGSFPVSVAKTTKISARMAVLLKLQEEERLLLRREWEVERRALEHEKHLLSKNHHLLKEQLSRRRNVIKRSQFAAEVSLKMERNLQQGDLDGDFGENKSSSDDNSLPADDRAAEGADNTPPKRLFTCCSIVHSEHQPSQLQQPALMECLAIHSRSDGIKQQHTSAFPELIPKKHEIIIDSNTSIANINTLSAKLSAPSSSSTSSGLIAKIYLIRVSIKLNRFLSNSDAKPIAQSSGLQTASLRSAYENTGSLSAIRANANFCMNGQQLRSPPNFVAPIVPDPAPPPWWITDRQLAASCFPSTTRDTLENVESNSELGDLARRSKMHLRTFREILLGLMENCYFSYRFRDRYPASLANPLPIVKRCSWSVKTVSIVGRVRLQLDLGQCVKLPSGFRNLGHPDGLSDQTLRNRQEKNDITSMRNGRPVGIVRTTCNAIFYSGCVGARGNMRRILNIGNYYNSDCVNGGNGSGRMMVKLEPMASVTGGSMLPLGALPAIRAVDIYN